MRRYRDGAVQAHVAQGEATAVQESRGWQRVHEKYRVSVDEYIRFREQGFLVVRNLVPREDVQELRAHTEDLMEGRVAIPGIEPPVPGLSPEEKAAYYLRIHMLHRVLEVHERYLLHPRILDVLEALIGPDVLAMQTMLFIKGPGKDGQGYHQDSYYIPTVPNSLCGAWLALDRADEENGCMFMTVGSQHEPVYPPAESDLALSKHRNPSYEAMRGNGNLKDITQVTGVSVTDEEQNDLTPIARKYRGREVAAVMEPGDVCFFGGHILHRSHANRSKDRFRRAFVGHYSNARSYTEWGGGNASHILARGDTHLPFAQPAFGTPCAALLPPEERRRSAPAGTSMMGGGDGMMGMGKHGDEEDDKH